jgi:hypothetical protein
MVSRDTDSLAALTGKIEALSEQVQTLVKALGAAKPKTKK